MLAVKPLGYNVTELSPRNDCLGDFPLSNGVGFRHKLSPHPKCETPRYDASRVMARGQGALIVNWQSWDGSRTCQAKAIVHEAILAAVGSAPHRADAP